MFCTVCRQTLARDTLEEQAIDRCRQCGGVWLDEMEFGAVVRRMKAPASIDIERRLASSGLECPSCGALMTPCDYAHDSGVYVNRCRLCGGRWLADGQLALIAQHVHAVPSTEALSSAMAAELRAENRWRRGREVLRSRPLSGAVAAMILVLIAVRTQSAAATVRTFLFLLFPLVCIWFSDEAGRITRLRIIHSTPGDMAALGGWLLLLTVAATAWPW